MIVEAVDSVDAGACLDAFVEEFSSELPMAAFPRFDYTMGQVKRAGEALKGQILWDESRREEILEIFAIANSWRDSHAYPMPLFCFCHAAHQHFFTAMKQMLSQCVHGDGGLMGAALLTMSPAPLAS
jgi:hypothetical protein